MRPAQPAAPTLAANGLTTSDADAVILGAPAGEAGGMVLSAMIQGAEGDVARLILGYKDCLDL